jgi:hypothetical protein
MLLTLQDHVILISLCLSRIHINLSCNCKWQQYSSVKYRTCIFHQVSTDEFVWLPSFETDDSGDGAGTFGLGLLTRERGSGLTGGDEAGSIFQGETLSGRGIVEGSSQRTFRDLQLDSGQSWSRFSLPTIVPVNLHEDANNRLDLMASVLLGGVMLRKPHL